MVTDFEQILIGQLVKQLFQGRKTTMDDLTEFARDTALQSVVNKTLTDKNAEFKVGDNGQLTILHRDGSNLYGPRSSAVRSAIIR